MGFDAFNPSSWGQFSAADAGAAALAGVTGGASLLGASALDRSGNGGPTFAGLAGIGQTPPGALGYKYDPSLVGSPSEGANSNYGLNDVWGNLNTELGRLQNKSFATSAAQLGPAPQFNAAQGAAASGTAAQGQAALGNAARISTAGDAAFQSQQQQLANMLQQTAMGRGASPADLQLQQGTQQQIAGQLAVLGSQRGSSNFALAQRSAADQTAAAQQGLNQQLGIQRAQETQNAQNALGSVLGTARGQAQGYNANQAQLEQQTSLANLANAQQTGMANVGAANQFGMANLENAQATGMANLSNTQQQNLANQQMQGQFGLQQGQFDQATDLANQQAAMGGNQQYYNELGALLGAQTGIGQFNQQAQGQSQNAQLNAALQKYGIDRGVDQANAQSSANMFSSLINTGATVGAGALMFGLSDQNVKTGIEGGNPMLQSFLEQLHQSNAGSAPGSAQASSAGTSAYGSFTGRNAGGGMGAGIQSAGKSLAAGFGALMSKRKAQAAHTAAHTLPGAEGRTGGPDLSGGPPNPDSLDFGQQTFGAYGDPMQAQGLSSSDVPDLSTMGLDFGRSTTPFTPASETMGLDMDPSVTAALAGPQDGALTLSDDQAKENVISGNRGMQQFLEQAGAQQNAQNQGGSYSNSFMQTGQAPRSQVDRQMTPGMVNAGYGGQPQGGGIFQQAGMLNGPGMTSQGGVSSQGGAPTPLRPPPMAFNTPGGSSGSYASAIRPPPGGSLGVSSLGARLGMGAPQAGNVAGTAPLSNGFDTSPVYGPAGPPPPPSGPPNLQNLILGLAGVPPLPGQSGGGGLMNAGLGAAGAGMLAMSDEDQKTSITSPPPEHLQAMLDQLHAHQYRYKDPDAPGAGHGTFVSPMAQELEKSPLGRNFVFDGPDGHKMVSYGKMAGTQLAASAMLNERVNRLEDLLRASARS